MRGNARSFAPIMIGIRKLPSTAGNRRDQEEEHHDHAVHGEQLVVGVGLDQVRRRRQQLEADHQREEPAQEEEDGDRQRDTAARCACGPSSAATTTGCGRCSGSSARVRWLPYYFAEFSLSDLTYAISCRSCSSVTSPWKVGMIGWNPATIFACGCRIDSRMYASSNVTVCPVCQLDLLAVEPLQHGAARPGRRRVWQVTQTRSLNSFAPASAMVPPVEPPPSHAW